MLSKLADWVFGKQTAHEESHETKSEVPVKPTPPPVPPRTDKERLVVEDLPSHDKARVDIKLNSANGPHQPHIPKALKSAFDRPEKDKKPFTYFAQGYAPDLSSKPSPRQVRQANVAFGGPSVPKVLPFVTDTDLRFEELRSRSPQMPTSNNVVTNSSQYNTPIALYSKQTVQEELSRQSTEPTRDINHVTNVRTHDKSPVRRYDTPSHRIESRDVDDVTPKYTGFVNPKSQSPCFKKLQYVTGLHTDSEDERPIEIKPSDVRRDERVWAEVAADTRSQQKFHHTDVDSAQDRKVRQTPAFDTTTPTREMHGSHLHNDRMTNSYHEDQRYYTYHYEPTPDQIEDPLLLAKISEAERPRVPAAVVPDWVTQAEKKHDKWRGYAEFQETHKYEGPPAPAVHFSPATWRRSASRAPTGLLAGRETPFSTPRAKSVEPSSYKHHQTFHGSSTSTLATSGGGGGKKEPWMKPFVAPNVVSTAAAPEHQLTTLRTLTTPLTIRTSVETPVYKSTIYTPSYASVAPSITSQQQHRQQSYEYISKISPTGYKPGPPPQWSSVNPTYSNVSSSTRRKETYESARRSPVPQYKIETTYLTPLPEVKHYKDTAVAVNRYQPQQQHAPWSTPRAETTTTSTSQSRWRFEQDAFNKQREMEEEVARKSRERSTGGAATQASPRWRPVSTSDRSLVTTDGPGVTQQWQDDTGASTKSQTTGSYFDKDGNVVTYVKEVYTTSDPGKEFSMLTQEERKVLEEPLQPGVISRQTTTKYYKKATYTSSSTTATTGSQPAISSVPFSYTAGGPAAHGSLTYPRKYTHETRY